MKRIIHLSIILAMILFIVSCAEEESKQVNQQQQEVTQQLPPEIAQGEQQRGIYFQNVLIATSDDAKTWKLHPEPIVEHASVPDVIQLEQDVGEFTTGTLLTYFVDASDSEITDNEKIGMIFSTDNGETWSEKEIVTFENADAHVPVDPSIIQLNTGVLRLYYLEFSAVKQHKNQFTFYVAESSDGRTFTTKQAVYTSKNKITDPDVIYFNNMWFMYFVDRSEGITLAKSKDGLEFIKQGTVPMTGIPGAVVVDDTIHIYGCSNEGIFQKISVDGIVFEKSEIVLTGDICDPSPITVDNSEYIMVLKEYAS